MIQFSGLRVPRKRTQCLPDFAIDTRGILRRLIDQLDPAAAVGIEFGMSEQIARLQNGFERIAQIVRERPQLQDALGRNIRRCVVVGAFAARHRFRGFAWRRLHTISLTGAKV